MEPENLENLLELSLEHYSIISILELELKMKVLFCRGKDVLLTQKQLPKKDFF